MKRIVVLALLLCAGVMACGEDASNDGNVDVVCTPGESQACVCTNGGNGAQVCDDAGAGFEACVCDEANNDVNNDGNNDQNNDVNNDGNNDANNDVPVDGFAIQCEALAELFYQDNVESANDWSGFWLCYQEENGCSGGQCNWSPDELPDYILDDDCEAGAAVTCTVDGAEVSHCEVIANTGGVEVDCSEDGTIALTPSGLPDHTFENYAGQGSLPPLLVSTAQNTTWSISTEPVYNDEISLFNNAGNTPGLMVNGVALFNQFAGNGAVAIADEIVDDCGGHPAMGQYHYHAMPSCGRLVEDRAGAEGQHSGLVGLVTDGFPIFGPYGLADAQDPTSDATRMRSCYIRQDGCDEADADCYSFDQDALDRGDCDLDMCNGRLTAVPESMQAALGESIYAY